MAFKQSWDQKPGVAWHTRSIPLEGWLVSLVTDLLDCTESPWPWHHCFRGFSPFFFSVHNRLAKGVYLLANANHKKTNSTLVLGFYVQNRGTITSPHCLSKTKSHYLMHSQGLANTATQSVRMSRRSCGQKHHKSKRFGLKMCCFTAKV